MSIWDDMLDRETGEKEGLEDRAQFRDDITPEELDKMLLSGIVRFQYRKKAKKGQPEDSGEIRTAWGTRKSAVITKIPHGGECPPKKVGYSLYFDMEKSDWRVFWSGRLIGVWDKVYTEPEFTKLYARLKAEEAKEKEEEVIPEE